MAIFLVLYISLDRIYLIHSNLYLMIPYPYLVPVGFDTTCLGGALLLLLSRVRLFVTPQTRVC